MEEVGNYLPHDGCVGFPFVEIDSVGRTLSLRRSVFDGGRSETHKDGF